MRSAFAPSQTAPTAAMMAGDAKANAINGPGSIPNDRGAAASETRIEREETMKSTGSPHGADDPTRSIELANAIRWQPV